MPGSAKEAAFAVELDAPLHYDFPRFAYPFRHDPHSCNVASLLPTQ
jgi:hypothetical protein